MIKYARAMSGTRCVFVASTRAVLQHSQLVYTVIKKILLMLVVFNYKHHNKIILKICFFSPNIRTH